jgi:cytochrome P450
MGWPECTLPAEPGPPIYVPGLGLWYVSLPADVRRVLLDPRNYRPDNALSAVTPIPATEVRRLASAGVALPPALANSGNACHPPLRRLVAQFLTGERVSAARPEIERLAHCGADQIEAALATLPTCDLVPTLTTDLPARVMAHMFGLTGAQQLDPAALKRGSASSLELFWGRPSPARQGALVDDIITFHRALSEAILDTRRHRRRQGLLGVIGHHRSERGRPLPLAQAASTAYFSLIAGHEATGSLLAILMQHVLATHGLWQRTATKPETVGPLVETVLQHRSPVSTWRRSTRSPTTLNGIALPAGAQLFLRLSHPPKPSRADRPSSSHAAGPRSELAFGIGPHRCPGAHLARAQAKLALRVTTQRLPELELAEDQLPPIRELLSFTAPERIPVTRRQGPRTKRNARILNRPGFSGGSVLPG